jgi:hypothetical protein
MITFVNDSGVIQVTDSSVSPPIVQRWLKDKLIIEQYVNIIRFTGTLEDAAGRVEYALSDEATSIATYDILYGYLEDYGGGGGSGTPLTIKDNSTTVDTNVDEINLLPPLEAIQTASGKVNVRLNRSALTGAMYEIDSRFAGITLGIAYRDSGTNKRVFIAENLANRIRVINTDNLNVISNITLTNAGYPQYISSLNRIWASNQSTGAILGIDPDTLTLDTSIAQATLSKWKFIEYLNPLSGNPRIYILSGNITASPTGSSIVVYDLVTLTFNVIALTTGRRYLDGVLIDNASSAMHRKIVMTSDTTGLNGLHIFDPETDTFTANSVVPTGLPTVINSYYIDYLASKDEIVVTLSIDGTLNSGNSRVAFLEIDTATTFNLIAEFNNYTRAAKIKYDEPNGVVICNQSTSGLASNQKADSKIQLFDMITYEPIKSLNLKNTSNTILANGLEIIGNGEAIVCQRDGIGNFNNLFCKVKYA